MSQEISQALASIVGQEFASTARAILDQHSADESDHQAKLPDAVVWPANSAEVSQILKYANDNHIPIVGWGAGTSLEGNSIPVKGGIVVNFQRMNQILTVHENDFQVVVQPGIFYKDMNRQLARYGLFFAPDPGANASIGGMIANNAAGTRTPKYGATRENVLALEVVLANGEIIQTGSRSIKQSAGYDMTHLFTGSEGTLGLITEATIRLAPIPQHFSAALAAFGSVDGAAEAVYGVIGSGITPAAIELLDAQAIRYINTNDGIDLPETPHLLMEFHGASEQTLSAELEIVAQVCQECGSDTFNAGVGREQRDHLWEGRHGMFEAMMRMHPNTDYRITDVSVPISNYPILATYAANLMNEMNLLGSAFGHAGDGNLHTIVFTAKEGGETEKIDHFNTQIVQKALALEGTCTGEHGIGIGKQKYMVYEHGEPAIEAMRMIKRTFDPNNILNPGKVVSMG